MDKETYERTTKKMARDGNFSLCCYGCGEDDPAVIKNFEWHHLDGRANSDYIIPLCHNCHAKITVEQNKIKPKDRSSKATLLKRKGMQLISQGSFLKVMGGKQVDLGHWLIEYDTQHGGGND